MVRVGVSQEMECWGGCSRRQDRELIDANRIRKGEPVIWRAWRHRRLWLLVVERDANDGKAAWSQAQQVSTPTQSSRVLQGSVLWPLCVMHAAAIPPRPSLRKDSILYPLRPTAVLCADSLDVCEGIKICRTRRAATAPWVRDS